MEYQNNQQQPQYMDDKQMPQQPPMHHMKKPVGTQIDKGALSGKVQQIFVFFYTALSILLTARFVFSLLGLNLATPFVNFVYQLTQPFMTPFANMFGVRLQAGIYRIEFEVLVALLVYALLFIGIAKLISIIFD